MRINWGVRITILYTSFVLFMGTMVYMCTRQHFDLVSPDYYAQELKYQQVINGTNNTRDLNGQVQVDQSAAAVSIVLPTAVMELEKGSILFYRPSNSGADFTVDITSNKTEVPRNKLQQGLYKVKTTWTANGTLYYDEQSIVIR